MESGQEEACDEDEGAVEDEKAGLVLHDVVAPSACHLGDSVDATDEDGTISSNNSNCEASELGICPNPQGRGIDLGTVDVLSHPQVVISAHDTKAQQDNNLENDTSDDGAVTALGNTRLVPLCGCRDTTADGLDDET